METCVYGNGQCPMEKSIQGFYEALRPFLLPHFGYKDFDTLISPLCAKIKSYAFCHAKIVSNNTHLGILRCA